MDVGASLDATLTAGAQWNNTGGWSDIWDHSVDFALDTVPPSVGGSLQAYVRPEIVLALYDVSGPDIYAQGGATLMATAEPPKVCWSLTGNLDSGVGIDLLSIGNLDISYEKQFLSYSKEFAANCDSFSVTTLPATDVTVNSATLNGEVNPGGVAASAYFEWGATSAYGNATPVQDLGNGETGASVVFNLTGLNGNPAYHYRLVGVNNNEKMAGTDKTFSTQASSGPEFGIGFDDLTTPDIDSSVTGFYYGLIPTYYNGLTWDNINVIDGLTSTGSGYQFGAVSPNNACYNAYGNPGQHFQHKPI